jgi:hypothetical protein
VVLQGTYKSEVRSLVPLIKESRFQLKNVGEKDVGGKPALGVLIKSKGQKDVTLFFDKASFRLCKEESVLEDENKRAIFMEVYSSEYKEISGVQFAMREEVYQNGRMVAEERILKVEFPSTIAEDVFTRP